jgi:hypothetical protein
MDGCSISGGEFEVDSWAALWKKGTRKNTKVGTSVDEESATNETVSDEYAA